MHQDLYKQILQSIPPVQALAEVVSHQGVEAYLVGGLVRDMILGRPSKDVDVVCLGSGIELAKAFAQKVGGAQVHVYANFGTAQVKTKGYEFEFVGARKESYQRDSRKPIVEHGTLRDDQLRRDFTINALAISLREETLGQILDPFDGLGDLKRRMIRTPVDPSKTFDDDPLRIMRAIRFAAQLHFDIDPDTWESIGQFKTRLSIVSMERISAELNKIILSPKPSYGFKLLFHSGVLEEIFPELVALAGTETRDNKSHKDNFYHTIQVLDNVAEQSEDLWLRWGALLHDIAKPATKRFSKKSGWTFHGHEDMGARMVPKIFRRMKLPLDHKMKFVQKMVRLHLRPIPLVREEITDSALRRLLVDAGDDLDALMTLCRADVTSKNPVKVKRVQQNFDVVEQKLKEVEERDHLKNFQPVISGSHIMIAFGLKPSKVVGIIKEQIKEAILEGEIQNELGVAWKKMEELGRAQGLEICKDQHQTMKLLEQQQEG